MLIILLRLLDLSTISHTCRVIYISLDASDSRGVSEIYLILASIGVSLLRSEDWDL